MRIAKVSDEFVIKAKIRDQVFKRTIARQIEYWATIAQENPLSFIQAILEEIRSEGNTLCVQ